MPTKQRVTGLFATAMATAAFIAGLTVVSPDTYHDMSPPATIQAGTAAVSNLGTADISPDTYHDM